MTLPDDAAARKTIPLAAGVLDYFPSALVAVAALSAKGNSQHNPGADLHWDRSKSGDEADALLRHLMERDYVGMAWRALALLQKHLEANGAPIAPGARIPVEPGLAALPVQLVDEATARAILRDLRPDDDATPPPEEVALEHAP